MANHGIFIPRQIAAMNVDIWNRHAIASGSAMGDIDNGSVFLLTGKSTEVDEFEVWIAAIAGSSITGPLWMAYSGEDFMPSLQPSTSADDIHQFTNLNGKVFPAFKPQQFDLITLNADALLSAFTAGDTHIVPVAGGLKMDWAASDPGSVMCFKLIQTIPLSFGSTSLNSSFISGRETAYIFECIRG